MAGAISRIGAGGQPFSQENKAGQLRHNNMGSVTKQVQTREPGRFAPSTETSAARIIKATAYQI